MAELFLCHCDYLPKDFLRDLGIEYMVFLYFIYPCEKCSSLVERYDFSLLDFLKHSTIPNQNPIFNSNIKHNSHNTRDSKPKRTRTRSNKYPNTSLNNPTKITSRNTSIIKAK